jgi:hypothetical protein
MAFGVDFDNAEARSLTSEFVIQCRHRYVNVRLAITHYVVCDIEANGKADKTSASPAGERHDCDGVRQTIDV